jgi:MFS family permease
MLLGGLFVTAAFVLPAISHANLWEVILSEVFIGAGIGLALASMSNAIIEAVPATQTGEAISVNTIFRSIGSAIGTAVVAAVISSNTTAQGIPKDNAFTVDFWICAAVAVVAVLAAIAAPSALKRRAEAIAHHVDDFAEVEKTPTGRTTTV